MAAGIATKSAIFGQTRRGGAAAAYRTWLHRGTTKSRTAARDPTGRPGRGVSCRMLQLKDHAMERAHHKSWLQVAIRAGTGEAAAEQELLKAFNDRECALSTLAELLDGRRGASTASGRAFRSEARLAAVLESLRCPVAASADQVSPCHTLSICVCAREQACVHVLVRVCG